jgi:hypothetical protein
MSLFRHITAMSTIEGVPPMRIRLTYITSLLAAGAAAAAIGAAPIAAAAPAPAPAPPSCDSLGGTQTECQSPGNAQVYDAPPQVDYFPYAGGAA